MIFLIAVPFALSLGPIIQEFDDTEWEIVIPIAFIAVMSLPVIIILYFKMLARRLSLQCPVCQHYLIGRSSEQITVATGRCGKCGAVVLEETQDTPS